MIPWWAHQLLTVCNVLLTIVFASFILRSKRAAGSTVAWLFFICAIPYIGIPVYVFLTDRKFKTKLDKKEKLYRPQNAEISSSITQTLLHASGIPNAKLNSVIALLPTGVVAFERIVEWISNAKKSIFITTFIFADDDVGRSVVELLTARAEVGVDVRILVDSLGASWLRHPSFRALIKAGGKVGYFMPLLHLPFKGRGNLRNHRKLMVVDEEFALLGGMNLAHEYLGPTEDPRRWVDLAVVIEGESVHDLYDLFLKDWAYATHANVAYAAAHTKSVDAKFLGQAIASGPDVVGDPLYDVILSAIYEAQGSVQIVTPYFIPDECLAKALELAAKRGVSVRVIIPRRSNHRLADLARGSFVRQLSVAGVQFGFFPKMIHAKVILVDQSLAILGSANFDMRSLLLNYELGFALYSKETLVSVENWIAARQLETAGNLPPAGFWREIAEGVGRIMGPII